VRPATPTASHACHLPSVPHVDQALTSATVSVSPVSSAPTDNTNSTVSVSPPVQLELSPQEDIVREDVTPTPTSSITNVTLNAPQAYSTEPVSPVSPHAPQVTFLKEQSADSQSKPAPQDSSTTPKQAHVLNAHIPVHNVSSHNPIVPDVLMV
jgi:hypothetical protein